MKLKKKNDVEKLYIVIIFYHMNIIIAICNLHFYKNMLFNFNINIYKKCITKIYNYNINILSYIFCFTFFYLYFHLKITYFIANIYLFNFVFLKNISYIYSFIFF